LLVVNVAVVILLFISCHAVCRITALMTQYLDQCK